MQEVKYPICQVIPTCQGEGSYVGKPSLLIRFNQCNLSCPWCDTKWAKSKNIQNVGNTDAYYKSVLEYIKLECTKFNSFKITNIMFTGGEPLLFIDIVVYIITNINKLSFPIETFEIQTNGTLIRADIIERLTLLKKKIKFNISPKIETNCFDIKDIKMIDIIEMYNNVFSNISDVIAKQKYNNEYRDIDDYTNIDFEFHIIYRKDWSQKILVFYQNCLQKYLKDQVKIFMLPFTPSVEIENFENTFKTFCHETMFFCLENGFNFSLRDHIILFKSSNDECLKLI